MYNELSATSLPVFLGEHTYQVRPAAALLVGTHCGKFLCIKRDAGSEIGHWGILGGMVDQGEIPERAALREAFEEGEFRPTGNIAFLSTFTAKPWGRPETPVHIFSTLIEKPVDIILNEEHSDLDWVTLNNWPNPPTNMMRFLIKNHGADLNNRFHQEHGLHI